MSKSKIVAIVITLGVFFGPFYRLFIYNNGNEIVDSAGEMMLMLAWIIGMIAAFSISVNKPFDKKHIQPSTVAHSESVKRKAA
jgi:hypothetical protein